MTKQFTFDNNWDVLIRIFDEQKKADLSKTLDRALNTWPEAPYWLVELSDKLKGVELPQCQSHGSHNG